MTDSPESPVSVPSPASGETIDVVAVSAPRSGFSAFWHDAMTMPEIREPLLQAAVGFVVYGAFLFFMPRPAEMLIATGLLFMLTRVFLVEIFYRAYVMTSSPLLRRVIQSVVSHSSERGFTGKTSGINLFSILFILVICSWPFFALGVVSLARQSAWTLALWMGFVLMDLLRGGIYMNFEKSLSDNHGYNALWFLGWVLCLFVLPFMAALAFVIGLFSRGGVSMGSLWDLHGVQWAVSLAILALQALLNFLVGIGRAAHAQMPLSMREE